MVFIGYVVKEPEEATPPYAHKPISRISHPSTNSVYSESEHAHGSASNDHEDDKDEHGHVAIHDTASSATAF